MSIFRSWGHRDYALDKSGNSGNGDFLRNQLYFFYWEKKKEEFASQPLRKQNCARHQMCVRCMAGWAGLEWVWDPIQPSSNQGWGIFTPQSPLKHFSTLTSSISACFLCSRAQKTSLGSAQSSWGCPGALQVSKPGWTLGLEHQGWDKGGMGQGLWGPFHPNHPGIPSLSHGRCLWSRAGSPRALGSLSGFPLLCAMPLLWINKF